MRVIQFCIIFLILNYADSSVQANSSFLRGFFVFRWENDLVVKCWTLLSVCCSPKIMKPPCYFKVKTTPKYYTIICILMCSMMWIWHLACPLALFVSSVYCSPNLQAVHHPPSLSIAALENVNHFPNQQIDKKMCNYPNPLQMFDSPWEPDPDPLSVVVVLKSPPLPPALICQNAFLAHHVTSICLKMLLSGRGSSWNIGNPAQFTFSSRSMGVFSVLTMILIPFFGSTNWCFPWFVFHREWRFWRNYPKGNIYLWHLSVWGRVWWRCRGCLVGTVIYLLVLFFSKAV